MQLYGLYFKKADGSYEGPAVGLFESAFHARQFALAEAPCPKTEFEIVPHRVYADGAVRDAATG